ncbi:MAG: branched-chain amino acid ABC transporter permease [Phycisphaerales bacterium]|nr:branched-chain amino acid ABC transporter permease [Phycisphaerales bacterium]
MGSAAIGWLPTIAIILAAVIIQITIRPMLGDFYAKVLLDIGVNIVLAVSLTMVNGFTGQFSMGHAAFMAVGGYTAATVMYYGSFRLFGEASMAGGVLSSMMSDREGPVPYFTRGDLLFLASTLFGGLVAAGCGYLVGLPSLRLRGDYLAIVTLGFGEIVRVLIQALTTDALYDADEIAATPVYQFPKYIGGALGFSGLPFYNSLFWSLGLAGLTILTAYRIKSSTFGRAFLSIREDEIAAEAMGVNTTRYKVRAFVIAAFFAGMAGALFAHTSGVQLNAGELGFLKSFDIIIMVVLGGLGSISGAAFAAIILTILPELLRQPAFLVHGWIVAVPLIAGGIALRMLAARRRADTSIPKLLIGFGVAVALLAIAAAIARSRDIDLGRYRMIFYALALIVIMIARPQGLLSVREIWERGLWRGLGNWVRSLRRETGEARP